MPFRITVLKRAAFDDLIQEYVPDERKVSYGPCERFEDGQVVQPLLIPLCQAGNIAASTFSSVFHQRLRCGTARNWLCQFPELRRECRLDQPPRNNDHLL